MLRGYSPPWGDCSLKLPPDSECPFLPRPQPFTKKEVIGFVIGSISSVLYLLSRLPQIRTNVSFR